jgi:guanylate kinase
LIVIVSGPGGVGKGTVVTRLLELEPALRLSRSWTTRPRRPGEAEDAYVFSDRDSFERRAKDGGFLEWTEFAGTGHLYGTPAIDPAPGEVVVLEIELDGARQVKERHPDSLMIMIVAPSIDVQAERLRGRGDAEEAVARRLAVGMAEEQAGRHMTTHIVVNDDVDRAAREVAGIIERYTTGGSSAPSA